MKKTILHIVGALLSTAVLGPLGLLLYVVIVLLVRSSRN